MSSSCSRPTRRGLRESFDSPGPRLRGCGFVGHRFIDFVAEEDRALVEALLGKLLARSSAPSEAFEFRIRHDDGRLLHTECLFTNLLDNPAVGGIVVNVRDVTERKQFEEQLSYQAFHDPITDLANSALFRDRVEHALSRRGEASRSLAVLFLDLDDFKAINDTFGHDIGDQVLQTISARLRSALREGDTAARLGGDEFAVLLEDVTRKAEISLIVARLLEIISAPLWLDGRELSVECSIGIAGAHSPAETGKSTTVDELLRTADVAMYQAKAAGGNTFRHFTSEMHETAVTELALRADLKAAIAAHDLTLAYQPIFDLETDQIRGYEALLRWEHPERGSISPATFIPAAEDSGLIVALGRWVLERACADAVAFQGDDSDAGSQDRVVSINISAQQLARVELIEEVRTALHSSGLDARCLMLEITESVMIDDVELAIERLGALRELGVQIAIDDFGTGYSSLSYILQLPLDVLKIDRRFIESVDSDGRESKLTEAIIGLTGRLGLRCIAEGVERPEQHERLKEFGCDYAQGFLLARPMSADLLRELLSADLPKLVEVGSAVARTVASMLSPIADSQHKSSPAPISFHRGAGLRAGNHYQGGSRMSTTATRIGQSTWSASPRRIRTARSSSTSRSASRSAPTSRSGTCTGGSRSTRPRERPGSRSRHRHRPA